MYPQANTKRNYFTLDGIWNFRPDQENIGEKSEWFNGFDPLCTIAVPGSWNEQLEELGLMNYVGKVWYNKEFYAPADLKDKRFVIRIGSADHHAKVWINGKEVGSHSGGFMSFEFEITEFIDFNNPNSITIMVDSQLNEETIPQSITAEKFGELNNIRAAMYPDAIYDFFPYGGIQRSVKLYYTSKDFIEKIIINTSIKENNGKINFKVVNRVASDRTIKVSIDDIGYTNEFNIDQNSSILEGEIDITDCNFWSCNSPYLYKVKFQMYYGHKLVDEYIQEVGVRVIEVTDGKFLLNGEPVYFKGFGKHEDTPVAGKGYNLPYNIKDFNLLKWINANSFRTSHYPYDEEVMFMADREGILIIDEVPAVSLWFRIANSKTLEAHKNALRELIERDQNHPSVIMWSLANEPNLYETGEPDRDKERKYYTSTLR